MDVEYDLQPTIIVVFCIPNENEVLVQCIRVIIYQKLLSEDATMHIPLTSNIFHLQTNRS